MQVKTGVVVSTKMQKAVTVSVEAKIRHPLYKKFITSSKKFKAQDEIGVKVGDKVKIGETKPISKSIRFKVLEVIKK